MNSLSFNGLTSLYDQTRTVDPTCFAAALDWIAARFPPTQFGRLLEPGIGTGRVALPLAARGYHVIGADISEEMLGVCAAQSINLTNGVHCVLADTTFCRSEKKPSTYASLFTYFTSFLSGGKPCTKCCACYALTEHSFCFTQALEPRCRT